MKDFPKDRGLIERELIQSGLTLAGIDEVGRGCIAGPVFAACFVPDYAKLLKLAESDLNLIRDSKTLSKKQRASVLGMLQEIAVASCVESASVDEIESLGILGATFLAMKRSFDGMKMSVDVVVIDGNLKNPMMTIQQMTVVKGDMKVYAIAAASILAKEARDAYMANQAAQFENYGFDRNVGYGTAEHLAAVRKFGITPLHRRNFAPISEMVR